jgi:hypothetical protein
MLRSGANLFQRWLLVCIVALRPAQVTAQSVTATVRDAGPGDAGRLLKEALQKTHTLIYTPGSKVRLPKDSSFASGLVIVGSDAAVASTVHGDVVVVNGDLFLHPGASIDGRTIALGGNVYGSPQATVKGQSASYPDISYTVAKTANEISLSYRGHSVGTEVPWVTLPSLYGFRSIDYTRVDGVSIAWGPRFQLRDGTITFDPTVTYRSDIGEFDPSGVIKARFTSGWELTASGAQSTYSNDRWIYPDFPNPVEVVFTGKDYRNYWRGVRYEGSVGRVWEGDSQRLEVSLGGRTEHDWSIAAGGPWSVANGDSPQGILRPNPEVLSGRISSAIAGIEGHWEGFLLRTNGTATFEVPWTTPNGSRFFQTTIDARGVMPTFGAQSLNLHVHTVLTAGDTAPPQRLAYLGGAGTLSPFDVLEFGGDELLWLQARYDFPIQRVQIPILGVPTISPQYAVGSAGIHRLPSFNHAIGLRLTLSLLYVSYDIDPKSGHGAVRVGVNLPTLSLPGIGPIATGAGDGGKEERAPPR